MSDWSDYVQRVAGNDTSTAIAEKTGINQSSIYRWINNGATPSPAHAAKFASAYRHNVLDAFIAAGFVSSEDIRPERDLEEEYARLETEVAEARITMVNAEQGFIVARTRHEELQRTRDQVLAELQAQREEVRILTHHVTPHDRLLVVLDDPSVKVTGSPDGPELEGDDRAAKVVDIVDWLVGDGSPERMRQTAAKLQAAAELAEAGDHALERSLDSIEGHEPPMDAAAHSTGQESVKERMMREQDEAAENQDHV